MNRFQRLAAMALIIVTGIFSSCNNNKNNTVANAGGSNNTSAANAGSSNGKIAYVNVDSLEEHYAYWKNRKQEMLAEQAAIESELQRSAQQLQNDLMAAQQKAQAGTLSEAEGRATEQRLGQMQRALEARRNTLSEQLQKKQLDFSTQLQKNIDDYLAVYNKDGKYDYILSYSRSGSILFANKALDITDDVLKGLNETAPKADTSKKAK